MRRVLLVATTTGYQTRAFDAAAASLGVDLVYATDRCAVLDDPWRDHAIPVRFHDPAESVAHIVAAHRESPFVAVVAVGDRPAVLAAQAREALGIPGHSSDAADAARHKVKTRERLRDAGLPVPCFHVASAAVDADTLARDACFPAVLKPVSLSGSRGVMRVDGIDELRTALDRLRALLARPDIRAERDPAHERLLLERFIDGHEFALEGVMTNGVLQTLAVFDKPDPLDGPFFEETIYITLPDLDRSEPRVIAREVSAAAAAIGLRHGPIHAECRIGSSGAFVLEVAARPIGGICARTLRFTRAGAPSSITLEDLLLRHAMGEDVSDWARETAVSGVMMIPIPRRGFFKGVAGLDAARMVNGVDDVVITAKADQLLLPLPEGASYLGFIFAHGANASAVDAALRAAHRRLAFTVDPELPVIQSAHG